MQCVRTVLLRFFSLNLTVMFDSIDYKVVLLLLLSIDTVGRERKRERENEPAHALTVSSPEMEHIFERHSFSSLIHFVVHAFSLLFGLYSFQ